MFMYIHANNLFILIRVGKNGVLHRIVSHSFDPALSTSFLKSPLSPCLSSVGSAGPLCVPVPQAQFSPALWATILKNSRFQS